MIAPLRQPEPETRATTRSLQRARRMVASALFPESEDRPPPSVANWVAWAFAGWVVVVSAAYVGAMLGWW